MRGALRCLAIVAVSFFAADASAQVHRGNDTGGIIPWSCENEAAARAIAAEHCARWDKVARITSVRRRFGDYIGFHCLWRPGIARYQLPPVRTRATCRAHHRWHPRVRARY